MVRKNMVKKNEEDEDDEEDDLIEQVAPVAMDLVKDQHVERLHPKYWLGAARSLRRASNIRTRRRSASCWTVCAASTASRS